MDKVSFFLLNVFVNSLLAFLTAALLIEGIIFLFRIRQGRVAAFLRTIPLLKLPLDLWLYDFSRWSYAQGINPLQCEGTRNLSVICRGYREGLFFPLTSSIQFTVPGKFTFTIADLIGYTISASNLRVFSVLFASFSLVLFIRKLFLYFRSVQSLNSLAKSCQLLSREIRNFTLSSRIKKRGLQLLTSPILEGSPFVAGLHSPIVYVPGSLIQNLSPKEYEAVLGHEIEHVRHRDNLARLLLDLLSTLFWWVPTKWLRNRIEEGQEVSCDSKCRNYGIDPIDLASAICKSARCSGKTPHSIFTRHLTKHTISKRVNILLQPPVARFRKIHFAFTCFALITALSLVFLGKFWTF